MVYAYCETCEWSYELGEDEDRTALDHAMIDHHAETGHPVVASDAAERFGPDERDATGETSPDADPKAERKRN